MLLQARLTSAMAEEERDLGGMEACMTLMQLLRNFLCLYSMTDSLDNP